MRDEIGSYIRSLSDFTPPCGFFNPYKSPEAVGNLTLFLSRPKYTRTLLLVGEAPGYRGGSVTGVPLCSSAILITDWKDPWRRFGPDSGFKVPKLARFSREATATMVWQALAELFFDWPCPLTWNAVPFEPHGCRADSNGSLKPNQIEIGRQWLEQIIQLFPESTPVAVGQRAADALLELGVEYYAVRHPSRGGKQAFMEGLANLKKRLSLA